MATIISVHALKALLESPDLSAVIDVRDWGEFVLEQIPGASSVPRGYEAGFSVEQGLGKQKEFEELAIAEVGLLGSGPYGYSNERMAQYLRDEEVLGKKYQAKG